MNTKLSFSKGLIKSIFIILFFLTSTNVFSMTLESASQCNEISPELTLLDSILGQAEEKFEDEIYILIAMLEHTEGSISYVAEQSDNCREYYKNTAMYVKGIIDVFSIPN